LMLSQPGWGLRDIHMPTAPISADDRGASSPSRPRTSRILPCLRKHPLFIPRRQVIASCVRSTCALLTVIEPRRMSEGVAQLKHEVRIILFFVLCGLTIWFRVLNGR